MQYMPAGTIIGAFTFLAHIIIKRCARDHAASYTAVASVDLDAPRK